MERVLVDMSCTLLHHGHIRLLKKASKYGKVIVALTTDDEIFLKKGYWPELSYQHRYEIISAIKYGLTRFLNIIYCLYSLCRFFKTSRAIIVFPALQFVIIDLKSSREMLFTSSAASNSPPGIVSKDKLIFSSA